MGTCSKCGASYAEDARFCAHCGEVVGAEELARLKEKQEELRVRAAKLAEERAESVRHEAERLHEQQRARLRDAVNAARAKLETSREEATSVLRTAFESIKGLGWGILTPIFIGSLLFHMIVFPAIGRTPAEVVCPLVCSGCSRPARVFSWNFRGQWHSENGRMGYAFVCSNTKIDVRGLTESDIWTRNRALQPYMLNAFASSPWRP